MLSPNNQMNMQDWFMLVLLALIWGGAFFFARIAVDEIPPLTLVFLRVSIAALALNLMFTFKNSGLVHTRKLWLGFAVMGLLNNIIPFTLLFYGQQQLGAGLASIINALTPVWSLLFSHFATLDEKLSASKLLGVMAGFTGVGVMIGDAALTGLDTTVLAFIAVVGATISYGAASVYGRRFSKIPPLETARGQLTMSTLVILSVVLIVDKPWSLPVPSPETIGAVLILALVCTTFAYFLFFRILASAGAVNISLVTLLIPVSAIFLGITFLGEVLVMHHIVGLALIAIGLGAIDGRPATFLSRAFAR